MDLFNRYSSPLLNASLIFHFQIRYLKSGYFQDHSQPQPFAYSIAIVPPYWPTMHATLCLRELSMQAIT